MVKRDYCKMLGVIWDTVRSVNVLETNKSDRKEHSKREKEEIRTREIKRERF